MFRVPRRGASLTAAARLCMECPGMALMQDTVSLSRKTWLRQGGDAELSVALGAPRHKQP